MIWVKHWMLLLVAAVFLPAVDISGTWIADVDTSAGSGSPTFTFKQDGETLTGTYSGALGTADVKGTIRGDQVEFWFDIQGGRVEYRGTLENSTRMKGSVKIGPEITGSFTAAKK